MLEELCKQIQHCCATLRRSRNKRNVGSCWLKSLTSFKLCTTTCNNIQQGVQTDATCNNQQCCVRLHRASPQLPPTNCRPFNPQYPHTNSLKPFSPSWLFYQFSQPLLSIVYWYCLGENWLSFLRLQSLITASRLFATLTFNYGCYSMVLPFKWKLHGRPFLWYYLVLMVLWKKKKLEITGGKICLIDFFLEHKCRNTTCVLQSLMSSSDLGVRFFLQVQCSRHNK